MNKSLRTLSLLLLVSTSLFAQIPNPSFELWLNSLPVDWTTNSVPPTILPVSQSTDAHSGTYAARGQVINYMGNIMSPLLTPFSSSGYGIPITEAHESLTGWYKSSLVGADLVLVELAVYDNTNAGIGIGFDYLGSSALYEPFVVPIAYFGVTAPASVSIIFSIIDTTGLTSGTVGSNFLIDDLAFTPATTGIPTVSKSNFIVSPNPVSNHINVTGDVQADRIYHVRLVNSEGKIVLRSSIKSTSTGLPAIDVSNFSNGYYLLYLTDGKNSSYQKVVVNK